MQTKIKQVMSHLGKSRSEKKRCAVVNNGRATQFKPKQLKEILCNCGGNGLVHKSTCPRGRAIRYRLKKGLPLT